MESEAQVQVMTNPPVIDEKPTAVEEVKTEEIGGGWGEPVPEPVEEDPTKPKVNVKQVDQKCNRWLSSGTGYVRQKATSLLSQLRGD